jgi:ribose 5-phosphate isomerase B
MQKKLITEQDINKAHRDGCRMLYINDGDIITPAARDRAKVLRIDISKDMPRETITTSDKNAGEEKQGKVVIGSDHGGFAMKVELVRFIEELGYGTMDVGTHSDESCDYPEYAYAVAYSVSKGEAWRGIMIDGAGIGSCVAANKVPGVRAANCYNEFTARNSREHNDANMLTLGSRAIGIEVVKSVVSIFLGTTFAGGRHKKRVDKIIEIEKRFVK